MRMFGQGASVVVGERPLVDNELQLYAVADVRGEVALGVLRQEVRRLAGGVPGGVEASRATLVEALRRAYAAVQEGGEGLGLTALWVVGASAVVGHLGASRLYVLRGGELTRVEGGASSSEVDAQEVEVQPGDCFLLCTEGLARRYAGVSALHAALESQPRHAQPAALVEGAAASDASAAAAVLAWVRPPAASAWEPATGAERHLGALSRAFLFEGLPLGELRVVLQACESVKHPHGARLLEPGQRCEQLMIPVYGRLALMPPRGGVVEVGASVVLGASTLLRPRGARCGVRVLEPTRLLVLTRGRFEALAQEHPALGVALLTRLARHLSAELDGGGEGEDEASARERAQRRLV